MKIVFLLACAFLLSCGCGCSLYHSAWLRGSDHQLVQNIIGPLNEARAKGRTCGHTFFKSAQPVVWNDKLGDVSMDHSLDMAKTGHLGHGGSDASGPEERISRSGYRWASYGENIGQGYRTPEYAIKAWLKNEVYCANIMNPGFREAGAAYAKNSNLRSFWTLILARPKR